MEKLQHRHLHGLIAAITPTPSSLARYHSAASPEASAALLAVPKTQQMTFPKQAYHVFPRRRFWNLFRRFLFAAAHAGRISRARPTRNPPCLRLGTRLVCVCPKGRQRFVTHDSMALCIHDMAKAAGARMPGWRIRYIAQDSPLLASILTTVSDSYRLKTPPPVQPGYWPVALKQQASKL